MLGDSLNATEADSSADQQVTLSNLNEASDSVQNRIQSRVRTNAKLRIRACNDHSINSRPIKGHCRDISKGGIGAVSHRAPIVGDIYWLEIAHPAINYEPVIARCVRCRFVAERTFDVGFVFFETPELAMPEEDEILDLL